MVDAEIAAIKVAMDELNTKNLTDHTRLDTKVSMLNEFTTTIQDDN